MRLSLKEARELLGPHATPTAQGEETPSVVRVNKSGDPKLPSPPFRASNESPGKIVPLTHRTSVRSKAPPEALLGQALPRLWQYVLASTEMTDTRKRRKKLRELIAWILDKRGYIVRGPVHTPFRRGVTQARGRLELLVEDIEKGPVLALETDFTEAKDSVAKLEAWHEKGVTGMWILGKPCRPEELYEFRLFANKTLGRDTRGWLLIYHLEHGWIREKGPAIP